MYIFKGSHTVKKLELLKMEQYDSYKSIKNFIIAAHQYHNIFVWKTVAELVFTTTLMGKRKHTYFATLSCGSFLTCREN